MLFFSATVFGSNAYTTLFYVSPGTQISGNANFTNKQERASLKSDPIVYIAEKTPFSGARHLFTVYTKQKSTPQIPSINTYKAHNKYQNRYQKAADKQQFKTILLANSQQKSILNTLKTATACLTSRCKWKLNATPSGFLPLIPITFLNSKNPISNVALFIKPFSLGIALQNRPPPLEVLLS